MDKMVDWKFTAQAPGIIKAEEFMEAVYHRKISGNEVSHATVIDGDIKLNSLDCDYKLVVHNTTFTGHFDFSEARFNKTLDLSFCTFKKNVNFAGTQIDRSLLLTGARIFSSQYNLLWLHLELWWFIHAIKLIAPVNGRNAARSYPDKWWTWWFLTGARIVGEQKPANFEQVFIKGNFDASSTNEHRMTCSGSINLNRARVLGKVSFNGAKIRADLSLQGAEIRGNLFCRPKGEKRTEIGGRLWLRGAKIKSQVDLGGASIGTGGFAPDYEDDQELPIALAMEAIEIEGGLLCSPFLQNNNRSTTYRTEILGYAWLSGARVKGKLDFSGACIEGDLDLREAKIEGKLDLATEIFGSNLYCTEIAGKANLTRVKVSDGVFLGGVKVGRDLDQQEGLEGALILKEAEIQGGLKLESPEFNLTRYSNEVKEGDLLAKVQSLHLTQVYGAARLSGARISGGANLSGAIITGSLILKGTEIAGDLECQPFKLVEEYHPTIVGEHVELVGANVEGIVDFSGICIGQDLKLEDTRIERDLKLTLKDPSIKLLNCNMMSEGANRGDKDNLEHKRIGRNLSLKGTNIKGGITCELDQIGEQIDFQMCSTRHMRLLVQSSDIKTKSSTNVIEKSRKRLRYMHKVYRNFIFSELQGTYDELLLMLLKPEVKRDFSNTPKLSLAFAEVVELEIPRSFSSRYSKQLNLEGFKYQRLKWQSSDEGNRIENHSNPKNGKKIKKNSIVELLEAAEPFPKDVYLLTEKYLRNQDAEVDANSVYLALKRRDRKRIVSEEAEIFTWYQALWTYFRNFLEWLFLELPTGYGTNYSRVSIHLLGVWILSFFLFLSPNSVEPHIAITTNDVMEVSEASVKRMVYGPHPKPSEWPWPSALWESTQVVFPIVSISASEKWEPSSMSLFVTRSNEGIEKKSFLSYENYASLISLFSWLLVPSLLARVPGINRGERKGD